MDRSTHGLALGALVALGMHDTPAAADATQTALAAPPVNAVWVEQERSFTYFGHTTYYSCYGLRDKVSYVLRQLGARPGYSVRVSCVESGGSGVESMPRVRVKAAFAAEATPAVLEKLAAGAAKRELIARVQGKDAQSDAATAQFPARWQRTEFKGWRDRRIDDGDCELLEQLLDQVLVPMGARVAPDSRLSCARGQLPLGAVRLQVETLTKVPEPDAAG